jgi:eukaryotic-like serine/threonine-protein kinase
MGNLFQNLKKRKVFTIAAVYAVVAWLSIQIIDVINDPLSLPDWFQTVTIVLFAIGFPIALILAWAYEVTPEGIKPDSGSPTQAQVPVQQNQLLIYAIFFLVLLVAGFQFADGILLQGQSETVVSNNSNNSAPASSQVTRSLINLGTMQYREFEGVTTNFDFTPDGSRLVYSSYVNGNYRLHVRNLAALESQTILQSNTLSMFSPRVSPDGTQIIFIDASFNLYAVQLLGGGTPTLIAENARHEGYTWLSNREVIFSQRQESGLGTDLLTVSAAGGEPEQVTVENINQNADYRTPVLLPGGQFLLYSVLERGAGSRQPHVELLNLSTNQNQTLLGNAYAAKYVASGHLVFARDGDLWAAPFDLDRMQVTGQEIPVISGVENHSVNAFISYTVSPNGQLLYLAGIDRSSTADLTELGGVELVKTNIAGQQSILNLPVQAYKDYVLAPDGIRLALTIRQSDSTQDVWVYHLERETLSRITYSGNSQNPLWSPDGQQIYFEDFPSGLGIWQVNSTGLGVVEQLIASNTPRTLPKAFSPDGSKLIYMTLGSGNWDFQLLSFDEPELDPQPLITSEFTEWDAEISPDGRWLAYKSDETGRHEVYVRSFPNVDERKIQISNSGGSEPKWSSDGNTLFYIDDEESSLVSVPVTLEPGFSFGSAVTLAAVSPTRQDPPSWVLLPDNESFLIENISGDEENFRGTPRNVNAVLVENWTEELKRLAPPDPQ